MATSPVPPGSIAPGKTPVCPVLPVNILGLREASADGIAQGAAQLCAEVLYHSALCSMAPFMAKTPIFYNFHYSGTPKKEKAVKVGNQTVMTPQAVDGTGVVIGPETGLVGVEVLAGWGFTKTSLTCVTPGTIL